VFDSEATGDHFFMGAITDQPGEIVIYKIKAKDTTSTITKAGYWNWRTDSSPRLLGGSGLNVDIVFSAQTGEIMSALFSSGDARSAVTKEGGVRVLRGAFSSVWQAGVNLAPHGAKEVRIDAQSGRIVGLQ
jgi:hypothetical protein